MSAFLAENVRGELIKKLLKALTFFSIFVFTAIRFDVGPDYFNYYKAFETVVILDIAQSLDYQLFVILSKIFSFSESGFVGVMAVYFLATFYLIYKELSDRKILFLGLIVFFCFGFYFDSIDRIRQFLAIGFFIISIKHIESNNFFKYILCIFFGSLCHSSLILVLPIYFLAKVKIRNVIMLTVIMMFLAINILGLNKYLIDFVYNIVPMYAKIYSQSMYAYQSGEFRTGLGYISKILVISYILFCTKDFTKIKTIVFFGVIIDLVGVGNLNISRYADYFLSALIILIPYYIKQNERHKLIILPIFAYLILLFQVDLGRTGFEYQTIFSEQFELKLFNKDVK